MKKFCSIILVLCTHFLIFSSFADQISKITISGNNRVETSTIKAYIGTGVGDDYSGEVKNKIVRKLHSTGLFEDASIKYNNGILNINVKESPFVSQVKFTGNSKVKTDILKKHTLTSAGESLKTYKIQSDVQKIKEIYQKSGRFAAKVTSKIDNLDNNRVKITFEIDEGPKTAVKQIYFVGNEHYTASELKSIIMTKESKWFRFLSNDDTYDPARIEYDKHLLKQFYGSVGFADFRTISVTSELLPTKEGFIITYSIDEGKRYSFNELSLNNKLSAVKDSSILALVDLGKGDVFNIERIQSNTDAISKHLSDLGFPDADVQTEFTLDTETQKVDVLFKISKTSKQYINKINITGNVKTEDHVIRRELQIEEGDVFNRSQVEKGTRNIRNLNYFSDNLSVTWDQSEYTDRYDLNIDVEEKSTSNIGLEVGYDTSSGIFGKLSFIERNLIGTGRILNLGVRSGKSSRRYYFGITDPYFQGHDFALGFNIFHSTNSNGSEKGFASASNHASAEHKHYSSESTGGSLLLGYDITNDLIHQIEYEIKRDFLKSSGSSNSVFIQEQLGNHISSSVSHTLVYDQTDNRHISKDGYIFTGLQQFTGLGGDNRFIKHEANAKFYKSFFENKYTLSFASYAGHMKGVSGRKVLISDRFNVGSHNLRGFAHSGIGPRVRENQTNRDDVGESLGGQKYYTMSTELSTPLPFVPKEVDITASIFLDAGALWDADSKIAGGFHNSKSLRAAAGFGFVWVTPMAPIKLNWGFPLRKKNYDETERFSIRFSTEL